MTRNKNKHDNLVKIKQAKKLQKQQGTQRRRRKRTTSQNRNNMFNISIFDGLLENFESGNLISTELQTNLVSEFDETENPIKEEDLQSICHTIIYDQGIEVICADISVDSTLLAVGFDDGCIKIWSLSGEKLYKMKKKHELRKITDFKNTTKDNYLDKNTGQDARTLYGHSGVVYDLNFSSYGVKLLSCSTDATIRLWSTDTWQIIAKYEAPLCCRYWNVRFSPCDNYFIACSIEKIFKMFVLTQSKCIRIFLGHTDSVHCVEYHPKSDYIASGSHDCTIKLWDIATGTTIITMIGHKRPVQMLKFSKCGHYLISTDFDDNVLIWDLKTGNNICNLKTEMDMISTMSFNIEGNILAIGGLSSWICLWNVKKLTEDIEIMKKLDEYNEIDTKIYLITILRTKDAPIIYLTFPLNFFMFAVAREVATSQSKEFNEKNVVEDFRNLQL